MDATTVEFTRSVGLGSTHPEAPPEFRGTITAFGFPAVVKRLHKSLKNCINKIPRDTDGQGNMREQFLKFVAADLSDQNSLEKFCSKLGYASALRDLIENRISQMTSVDFIVDEALATPNQATVKKVTDDLLREDHERFARVPIKPGQQHTEWDAMGDEGPSR